MATLHLGFLASHGGSNMQAIIDACKDGRLDARPCVVISNNSDSMALQRARNEGIPCSHISGATHPGSAEDEEILRVLRRHAVDTVILAGYMKILGSVTLHAYRGRILNIHPALLPKFGGKGMYGKRVHEAVLAAGERVTGVTIHLIDENYDTGPIVNQCQVPVLEGDTPDSLSKRVLKHEHALYVETLQKISDGRIRLP
ncbi:MAG: phosphoribosylglycinamide formyltransferase [candidate division NC10 bacterium RIFCSPLOWO2_02_FULL_66_22]|nr:MAG: phosphoribosylglycinamide formyltransferase [candidate division NC10 bacterium RIFCSPLOWO2_02_FULL_66_22]